MTTYTIKFTGHHPKQGLIRRTLTQRAATWSDAIDALKARVAVLNDCLYPRYDFNDPQRASKTALRIARNAGPEEI